MSNGFVARVGFHGVGFLSVSRGYGPLPVEEVEVLLEDETAYGTGRRVLISATTRESPKALIRFPNRKKKG